jgi:hypothetical protein
MASNQPVSNLKKLDPSSIASYLFAALVLIVVMVKGLLGALFAGLLM